MSERDVNAGSANALGASDLRFLNVLLALLGGESEGVARALHGIDVDRFRRWCLRQQLGGYVYLLLEEMSLAVSMAPSWSRDCAARTSSSGRAPSVCGWGSLELAALLRDEGESFLVLKGLPFAQRYYGSHDRRADRQPRRLGAARPRATRVAELLERRGFERSSPRLPRGSPTLDHVHQVELDFHGIGVELHHALRVHRTFRIDETRLSASPRAGGGHGVEYDVPSDEHALLLHLLGLHTDIQIGQTNARWFADVFRDRCSKSRGVLSCGTPSSRRGRGRHSQDLRQQPGALLGPDPQRRAFPALSAALDRRRADIVLTPDRLAYLDLLRGASMLERKLWPLRQYEEGTAAAVSWWVAGMPRRIAAKPDAFARDVSARPEGSVPWETTELESTRSELENEFGVDPATFQETFLRFGSLRVQVRYQTAVHLDAVEELFRLRPRQVGHRRLRRPGSDGRSRPASLPPAASSSRCCAFPACPWCAARSSDYSRSTTASCICGCANRGRTSASAADRRRARAFSSSKRAAETRPLLLHSLMVCSTSCCRSSIGITCMRRPRRWAVITSLFVGAKGSGKSTITLVLGKAGRRCSPRIT